MNEWTVVTVLIALIGLFITVGKPILTLNSNVVKLNINVEQNNKELEKHDKAFEQQKKDAQESHQRLWDKNDEQDKQLADHETRLGVLERTTGN